MLKTNNKNKIIGRISPWLWLFLSVICLCCTQNNTPVAAPNIIYLLADDLGYGELGIYGQRIIKTPNIDALARAGMRFTQHYSGAPVCAPSRYMLLTGLHAGHAYIRGNDEWDERGDVWDYAAVVADATLEGQRPIPAETFTLAEMLHETGYATGIVGKWGLGAPGTFGDPNHQCFDYFFGYNCQRQAHNLYPKHLWENQNKIGLNNELILPGTILDSLADPNNSNAYLAFEQMDYAPAMIQEKALAFIEEHQKTPFFLYYASPLPHLPLQAPSSYVAKYREIIGPEVPYPGGKGYFPNQYPRATYAAMINYLDDQVGELIAKLKELGLYENTLIIFTSDNGPTYDVGGVDPYYFQSAGPFKTGRGWGKGDTHEAGIRVPMIAAWEGKIKANSISDHISAFWDVMPTLASLVGFPKKIETDGISFLPELITAHQKKHPYLYWEFPEYGGQQAVRIDHWKAIRHRLHEYNLNIKLYDLKTDPREERDVSSENPDIIKEITAIMSKEHTPSQIARFHIPVLGDK